MPDSGKLPRLYDEREVGKILERATELQRQEPARAAESGGLSLEELEEIALETGIDPRHLRRAAVELDSGEIDPSGWDRLVGDHTTLVYEATVPGELGRDDFEGVVSAIQQVARGPGRPRLRPRPGPCRWWSAPVAERPTCAWRSVSTSSPPASSAAPWEAWVEASVSEWACR
jgi:hypothetical protein